MVHDRALRGYSARPEARVGALLVAAGAIASAVGADEALGSAGRRGSSESGDARANRLAVGRATVTVRSAGGRVARVGDDGICFDSDCETRSWRRARRGVRRSERARLGARIRTLHDGGARDERVAGGVSRAAAHRQVIDDVALRAEAARAGARVATLVSHARPVARAVGVDDAFGPAADVRVAKVLGYAGAHAVVAPSIWTARRWIASVGGRY